MDKRMENEIETGGCIGIYIETELNLMGNVKSFIYVSSNPCIHSATFLSNLLYMCQKLVQKPSDAESLAYPKRLPILVAASHHQPSSSNNRSPVIRFSGSPRHCHLLPSPPPSQRGFGGSFY